MSKGKIITAGLAIVALVLLTVLALYVRAGATADTIAVLKTDGMTCLSCSETIAKALKREKGVAVSEVDVNGGWVVVGYDSQSVKPETLVQRVTASGFRSNLQTLLTPEQFRQITGREIGMPDGRPGGCCSGKGGCNPAKQKS
jgi:copper chaperone CopZ